LSLCLAKLVSIEAGRHGCYLCTAAAAAAAAASTCNIKAAVLATAVLAVFHAHGCDRDRMQA